MFAKSNCFSKLYVHSRANGWRVIDPHTESSSLSILDHQLQMKYWCQSLSRREFTCNAGNAGSIPRLGRYPGGGNDNPLQYSCLENPMDGGAWRTIVHGITESVTAERLHFHFLLLLSVFIALLNNKMKKCFL